MTIFCFSTRFFIVLVGFGKGFGRVLGGVGEGLGQFCEGFARFWEGRGEIGEVLEGVSSMRCLGPSWVSKLKQKR